VNEQQNQALIQKVSSFVDFSDTAALVEAYTQTKAAAR
jgi:hypothetical protein